MHKIFVGGDAEFTVVKNGYISCKAHHGVCQVTISGEKLSADEDAVKEFITKFEKIVTENNLVLEQIYNIDETELIYKMLLKKTLLSQNEL